MGQLISRLLLHLFYIRPKVVDRSSGSLVEEKVPSDIGVQLGLLYNSFLGVRLVAPSRLLREHHRRSSRALGDKYDHPESKKDIPVFIQAYGVDLSELADPVSSFPTLNAFFTRRLRPSARPTCEPHASTRAVQPTDGRLVAFSSVTALKRLWVKGHAFSIPQLLGWTQLSANGSLQNHTSPEKASSPFKPKSQGAHGSSTIGMSPHASPYESPNWSPQHNSAGASLVGRGAGPVHASIDHASRSGTAGTANYLTVREYSVSISRLAPQDYHRFHSPVTGVVTSVHSVGDELYTVKPIAIHSAINVLGVNKRVVIELRTTHFGTVHVVAVGACHVGSIELSVRSGDMLRKGAELGLFAYGGSTVVTVFKAGAIDFDADLLQNSRRGVETLVRMGESLGTAASQ